MGSTREEYEPWLRDYFRKRYPELESALLEAIDAFDATKELDRINSEQLRPIVQAASSSRCPLYENTTGLLGQLSVKHEEARKAIEAMATDAQSHIRFNAILCLGKSTPPDFTLRLIRQGLRDKSARVRLKASDWAGRLRIREVVPELEEALAREKNEKAKKTIEFDLGLLRDGYILEPLPDGPVSVTTFCRSGLSIRHVKKAELDTRGLKSILGELASQ